MFKLGFCVYGPQCRYRHTRASGPPPDPSTIEAAKPRDFRNINVVVNSVNTGIAAGERPGSAAGRGRGPGRQVLLHAMFDEAHSVTVHSVTLPSITQKMDPAQKCNNAFQSGDHHSV